MAVGSRTFVERRAAGEALIALIALIAKERPGKKDTKQGLAAEIGGFTLELRMPVFSDAELMLVREAHSQPIAFDDDVTPLGLISRLESALSRFEVELAEERRTLAEVSAWLPSFKARLGDPFPHQAELDERRAAMAGLEASLASGPAEAATAEDAA